jgi:hypothetical protein
MCALQRRLALKDSLFVLQSDLYTRCVYVRVVVGCEPLPAAVHLIRTLRLFAMLVLLSSSVLASTHAETRTILPFCPAIARIPANTVVMLISDPTYIKTSFSMTMILVKSHQPGSGTPIGTINKHSET